MSHIKHQRKEKIFLQLVSFHSTKFPFDQKKEEKKKQITSTFTTPNLIII